MAKNIEMNIKNADSYEALYPKIDLTNNQGTALPLSSTSGTMDISRTTGSLSITDRVTGSLPTSRLNGTIDYSKIVNAPITLKKFEGQYQGIGSRDINIALSGIEHILTITISPNNIKTDYPNYSTFKTAKGTSTILEPCSLDNDGATLFLAQSKSSTDSDIVSVHFVNYNNETDYFSVYFNGTIIKISGANLTSSAPIEQLQFGEYLNATAIAYYYWGIGY